MGRKVSKFQIGKNGGREGGLNVRKPFSQVRLRGQVYDQGELCHMSMRDVQCSHGLSEIIQGYTKDPLDLVLAADSHNVCCMH